MRDALAFPLKHLHAPQLQILGQTRKTPSTIFRCETRRVHELLDLAHPRRELRRCLVYPGARNFIVMSRRA